jgi:hypothetical protein
MNSLNEYMSPDAPPRAPAPQGAGSTNVLNTVLVLVHPNPETLNADLHIFHPKPSTLSPRP